MKVIIHILLSVLIFFPILVFLGTYLICKRRKISKVRAVGIASDQTTFWLFFSVPLAITGVWDIHIGMMLIMFAIMIAMVFTFVEWRTKKEIEIRPLFRKVWRVYFLMLTITYAAVWIIGLVHSVVKYVTVV